jgi:hypothetical protein
MRSPTPQAHIASGELKEFSKLLPLERFDSVPKKIGVLLTASQGAVSRINTLEAWLMPADPTPNPLLDLEGEGGLD